MDTVDQRISSILLTCLSYADKAVKEERLAGVTADDWLKIDELARKQVIQPLLYHNLKSLKTGPPDYLMGEMKDEFLKLSFRNIFLYRELKKLLELFQENSISVIVLKGAYLAEAVYENIGIRRMSDIDLLVKKEDLARVDEELLKKGAKPLDYSRNIVERTHHFTYRLTDSSLWLEIHWALAPGFFPCRIDVDGLWNRSRAVNLAQTPARALCNEDLLLHLCLHMARHSHEMSLRMLYDIGEVLRCHGAELNQQELLARAREWGMLSAVYFFLSLAEELYETDIPFKIPGGLRYDNIYKQNLALARKRIIDASSKESGIDIPVSIAGLWKMKGYGNKIKFILKNLAIPRRELALYYPVPADSPRIYLYYPIWAKALLVRYGRILWRLIRGNKKTREEVNEMQQLREWLL